MEKKKIKDLVNVYNNKRIPLSSNQRANLDKIYPYYGAQGIVDYVDDFIFDGKYILVAEDGENLKSKKQNICNLVEGKFWVNNHAHILTANDENNTDYLYYNFNQINFEPHVTGSAQPKLNKENLLNIDVFIHSHEEQQKIAQILSNLDRKIALNQQINHQLEKMAKTLYDYWFVQFDFPDENGKPYKSSGGEMVWCEELKREVPKGWGVTTLGEFAELYQPKTISEKEMVKHGEYLVYGANGVIGKYTEYNHSESVVTITCRGNTCGTLNITMPFSWITANAMVVKPKNNFFSIDFIYNLLMHSNINNTISGSAQPQITRTNLSPLNIITPSIDIVKKYSEFTEKLFNKKITNLLKIQRLIEYRDFLLPMLMNGQVEIK